MIEKLREEVQRLKDALEEQRKVAVRAEEAVERLISRACGCEDDCKLVCGEALKARCIGEMRAYAYGLTKHSVFEEEGEIEMSKMTLMDKFLAGNRHNPEFVVESFALKITTMIRRHMSKTNTTQATLAERLNVSQPEVSQLLSNERNLTIRSLALIADALHAEWKIIGLRVRVNDKITDGKFQLDARP